jgi:hypothetical protein
MRRLPALLLALLALPLAGRVEVRFDRTDQRLEIITISGTVPGPTVLIFGGIHGDEPGGYFSSELLARLQLRRGNLIVVPRVNFPSIMLNRREVHGDMNRKFTSQTDPADPERQTVEALKKLMGRADAFINLHDANGFHRETREGARRNPDMYGQSLIVDADRFYSPRLGRMVDLAGMGRRIIAAVNRRIPDPAHHYNFWNHDSVTIGTRFPEMRKSATHYALTNFTIPAFGLEISKDLPSLELKVRYQLLAVEEILREFGLDCDMPAIDNLHPQLYWIELIKNGTERIRVNGGTNLRLAPGDRVVVRDVCASDGSGLSADILDWGRLDDIGSEFLYHGAAEIVVRKNNLQIGLIHLRGQRPDSLRAIHLLLDGRTAVIPNWGIVEVEASGHLTVSGTEPEFPVRRVDVRGFAALRPGADDAGVRIAPADLRPAYSFRNQGRVYFARIFSRGRLVGGFQVVVAGNERSARAQ